MRLAEFGADVADMGANIGQSVIEARQAKEAELKANAALLADLPGVPDFDLGGGPIGEEVGDIQQEEPTGLQEIPIGEGPDLEELGIGPLSQGLTEELPEFEFDPFMRAIGLPQKKELYQIAPALELQHRLENLALQEAERQGQPLALIYAKIQRMQNLPAVRMTQERLQLEEEFSGF
jgi:hypothetical protein